MANLTLIFTSERNIFVYLPSSTCPFNVASGSFATRQPTMARPAETNNGVTTSWLPMTTAWPSSAGCEKSFWKKVSTLLVDWDPGYGLSVQHGLSCHPPEMTQWWNAPMLGVDTKATQYSMGPVVCPKAYTTATKSTMGGGRTLVGCCPR